MTTYEYACIEKIDKPYVVKVSDKRYRYPNERTIHVGKRGFFGNHTFYIDPSIEKSTEDYLAVKDNSFFEKTETGDVLQINPDGRINVLWEKRLNEHDLTLFITNQCNANCLMCPQPPHKDDYSLLKTNLDLLQYTKDQDILRIGITGGEPTVKIDDLQTLLSKAYQLHPDAKIDLLTYNAPKISDNKFSDDLSA